MSGQTLDRRGLWIAVGAFLLWGVMPLWWHLMKSVPSFQIVLHRIAWSAVRRHETQLSAYARLDALTPAQHEALWGSATFYRALSTVNGGRSRETDLFDGVAE